MISKNITLRFGAAQRDDAHHSVSGELCIRSTKQMLQGASHLKVALGLKTQEDQHFFTDEQARQAIVKHKRVFFE